MAGLSPMLMAWVTAVRARVKLSLVYILFIVYNQSWDRREIFLLSDTPRVVTYAIFVSEKVYLSFKIMIIDLKLTVVTNHNKKITRACSVSFSTLLVASPRVLINHFILKKVLQWMESSQERYDSSECEHSSKKFIVLHASWLTLFSLQRGIFKIEQKKKLYAQLTDPSRFKCFLQVRNFWLTASPGLLPESLYFAVLGRVTRPFGPAILSNLASLQVSLELMWLRQVACCFLA